MRFLVIGKTGQLGSQLIAHGQALAEIIAPSRAELDILQAESLRAFMRSVRPDVVINTAAFHNLPQCEQEPQRAFAANYTAVRDLAACCRESGARFLTFSTDYVFDGMAGRPYEEGDRPGPLQAYGTSKLAGEYAALANHPEGAYVIRTCGIYGTSGAASKGGNFIVNRIDEAKAGKSLTIASEQIVSPTYAYDLAQAVLLLIQTPASPGVYHLVNEGACSWYELTCAALELVGMPAKVEPVDRGGVDLSGFRRPRFSALANTKAKALGIVLPEWRDALARFLKTKFG